MRSVHQNKATNISLNNVLHIKKVFENQSIFSSFCLVPKAPGVQESCN